MSLGLVVPRRGLKPVEFEVDLAKAARSLYCERRCNPGVPDAALFAMGLRAASKFDYLENKLLDHALGKSAFTMPSPIYLALCTVVPEDSKTGATITEASYTGYARKKIEAAQLTSAASGKSKNSAKLEFAECTSGSSTIIGWALCDAAGTGAGNGLYWGTCTSMVISTTQTPATVAAEQLVVEED